MARISSLRPATAFGHNLGVSSLQPLKDPGFVYSCMLECLFIQLTVQNVEKKKKKTECLFAFSPLPQDDQYVNTADCSALVW